MIEAAVNADSTKVVASGLPYRPAGGVILVTADSLCRVARAAFNARTSTREGRVAQVYLFQLGDAAQAYVVNGAYADAPWVYEFFTSRWVPLFGMATE